MEKIILGYYFVSCPFECLLFSFALCENTSLRSSKTHFLLKSIFH